jgi:hypothetical protein
VCTRLEVAGALRMTRRLASLAPERAGEHEREHDHDREAERGEDFGRPDSDAAEQE